MSGEVAISLLFPASLQHLTAGGWTSPGGSFTPFAGLSAAMVVQRRGFALLGTHLRGDGRLRLQPVLLLVQESELHLSCLFRNRRFGDKSWGQFMAVLP